MEVPKDKWIQLTVTYDGSSRAAGYKLYLNGSEMATVVDQDKLYKDIMFDPNFEKQPGIQFGAWERGKSLTGGKASDIVIFNRELTALDVLQLADHHRYAALLGKAPASLSATERSSLRTWFMANLVPQRKTLLAQLQALRDSRNDSIEQIPELMIMRDMPTPRKSYVLDRGLYDAHKEEVFPGVPQAILPMPEDLPANRLGLAKWLLHPDHPLTARVAVNRYWQMLFGRGLVKTSEDFGNQGEMPSHPQLLDWLAITYRQSGWDTKAIIRTMVLSATYRQSSVATPGLRNADPENVLLARGPSGRLTAEMLRDNALAASGLINLEVGGKSVHPYQPEGLWRINGATYVQDSGTDLYRRSLYTVWKRSAPNPTQATFDVGTRSSCIARRQQTNTPLQALILLNDPTFVEASRVMGQAITRAPDVAAGVTTAFRELAGRGPTGKELQLLLELRDKQLKKFQADTAAIRGWQQAGAWPPDRSLPAAQVAANAVVASTILNADATITKR